MQRTFGLVAKEHPVGMNELRVPTWPPDFGELSRGGVSDEEDVLPEAAEQDASIRQRGRTAMIELSCPERRERLTRSAGSRNAIQRAE